MTGAASPKAPRVLLVEDRPSIRHLVDVALRQEGMDVVAVATAEEALAALASRLPDIILLDLVLPGGGGERLARTLRTNATTRHIPVIIVSGLESGPAIVRAVDAQEFMPKPFDLRDLIERVHYHFARRRLPGTPA